MPNKTTAKGEYIPKNASKYIGKRPITYRSSWELTIMRFFFFDEHPNVICWSSESIEIYYQHPFKKTANGRPMQSKYIPDFFILYTDKTGKKHAEIIEVKPLRERPDYSKKPGERISQATKMAQVVNLAKWTAATAFCAKQGLHFRVASEDELFAWNKSKKSTKK
jgi:hypothetical protein